MEVWDVNLFHMHLCSAFILLFCNIQGRVIRVWSNSYNDNREITIIVTESGKIVTMIIEKLQ